MPALIKEPQFVTFNSGGVAGRRRVVEEGEDGWVPTFDAVPVISFAHLHGTDEQRRALASDVGKACRDVGFFYIRDSGLAQPLIKETFAVMERFFACSDDVKLDAHWAKSPACRGFEPFEETKKGMNAKGDLRESFAFGDDFLDEEQAYEGVVPPGTKPQNMWPSGFPDLRTGLYRYYQHVNVFARSLLEIFALALGLPEKAFEESYGAEAIWGMRALHYPPQEPDETNPGLAAHSDFSSFTLVCQEADSKPALEVLNLNGHWISAPPLPGCDFVVNTGDFLSQTTNGVFKSTIHRVFNTPGYRRYSLPFFFSPTPSTIIKPLPQFVTSKLPEAEPLNVGEHYVRRVLSSRKLHPSSIALQKAGVPLSKWHYGMMQGRGIPAVEEESGR